MNAAVCQRWREGRDFYRPAREVINTARLAVDLVDETRAKEFVEKHHYAHSYPAAELRAGLYRKPAFQKEELVGVAVFSVPMNQSVIPHHTGRPPEAGAELGRFVLLDDIGANAETFFLKRAFRILREWKKPKKAVLAYADPVPRRSRDGYVIKPGHVGTIYAAFSARYNGRSSSSVLLLADNGEVVSRRLLSKVRNEEKGRDYAFRELQRLGAPTRCVGESGEAYVTRILASKVFRRMKHPGNHVFVWDLEDRRIEKQPYPKSPEEGQLA